MKMKTVTLAVTGMMCAHCENRVNEALSKVAGVAQAKADAKANQVTCEFDETRVNVDTIKETIEDVGYDVA